MGAPLPRRTRDETRELLLLAGTLVADAVTDDDSPDQLARWLAYVRFDEVLRVTKQLQLYLLEHDVELPDGVARQRWLREHRAAVLAWDGSRYRDISKPSAYTVFASEDAFREELAARLLAPERFTDPSLMAAAFEAVADGPAADDGTTDAAAPSLSRTITQLADVEFARVQDLPAVLVELSSAAFCRNPVIGELVAGHLQASAAGVEGEPGLEALYERVLAAHGLRRRPGVRPDDLVVTFNALLTGFTYLHRVLPDGVRDDVAVPEGPRSLLSLAVEGALRQLTEPLADEGRAAARRG